eukprot:1369573-Amorphochlora_amoeboformis.AAC.3
MMGSAHGLPGTWRYLGAWEGAERGTYTNGREIGEYGWGTRIHMVRNKFVGMEEQAIDAIWNKYDTKRTGFLSRAAVKELLMEYLHEVIPTKASKVQELHPFPYSGSSGYSPAHLKLIPPTSKRDS